MVPCDASGDLYFYCSGNADNVFVEIYGYSNMKHLLIALIVFGWLATAVSRPPWRSPAIQLQARRQDTPALLLPARQNQPERPCRPACQQPSLRRYLHRRFQAAWR